MKNIMYKDGMNSLSIAILACGIGMIIVLILGLYFQNLTYVTDTSLIIMFVVLGSSYYTHLCFEEEEKK